MLADNTDCYEDRYYFDRYGNFLAIKLGEARPFSALTNERHIELGIRWCKEGNRNWLRRENCRMGRTKLVCVLVRSETESRRKVHRHGGHPPVPLSVLTRKEMAGFRRFGICFVFVTLLHNMASFKLNTEQREVFEWASSRWFDYFFVYLKWVTFSRQESDEELSSEELTNTEASITSSELDVILPLHLSGTSTEGDLTNTEASITSSEMDVILPLDLSGTSTKGEECLWHEIFWPQDGKCYSSNTKVSPPQLSRLTDWIEFTIESFDAGTVRRGPMARPSPGWSRLPVDALQNGRIFCRIRRPLPRTGRKRTLPR